jgi:mannosylfructose-6-phosphate phosphatase
MGRTLDRRGLSPIRLVACDLDGTLLGDEDAARRFRRAWESIAPDEKPHLVFNSGRLVEDMEVQLLASALPRPQFIIGGVGTMLKDVRRDDLIPEFSVAMKRGFDRHRIEEILGKDAGPVKQPEDFQQGLKSSWYLRDADEARIAAIEEKLKRAGQNIRLVYSSDRDLDVLPMPAGKGNALAWLANFLKVENREIVVAGDTGNDLAMFELEDVRGIAVANALPELKAVAADNDTIYQAAAPMADGVIEGLNYWGLFSGVQAPTNNVSFQ